MTSRITQSTISTTALRGLQGGLSRVQQLQQQLSSGKQISMPSDDPSGTAAAMTMRSQRAADDQYLRNIDQVNGRLSVTDSTLTTLSDRIRAVRETMVASRNGALSTDSRAALAKQVDSLREEITSLYDTTYLDRPIFGGSVQGQAALDATGTYIGDNAPVTARISRDAVVRTDVTGPEAAADVLPALLTQISADLTSTTGATTADFTQLDAVMSTVQRALGDVGARQSRVEATRSIVDSQRLDFTGRISAVEDIDLPKTIMDLQAQQVGYQAALGSAAKMMQSSLMDYLK
jgi:flagellar hook-associated protein 3 FlgL